MAVIVKSAAVLLLAFGLCASGALAARGDPQKKLTRPGQARARAASLQPADFPLGWRHTPAKKNDNQSDPRCSYYNPDQSDLVEIGDFDSPDFGLPDGSTVSSTTGVFRSVQMAKAGYSRVAQPTLAKCLAELFKKGAVGARTTIFSSAPLTFPSYGDRSNAFRIVASVSAPTARVRVYLDVFIVNRGAVDVAVLGLGIGRPLPLKLEQSLIGKVAQRAH